MTYETHSTKTDAAAQAPTGPTYDAHLRSAYFDLESDIHDLSNMAGIAWSLFEETYSASDDRSGWVTLRITQGEHSQLEFAVSQTMRMASELEKTYMAKFDEARAARAPEKATA